MHNGSKRTISRVLAFVMLVTCMFSNLLIANATDGGFFDGEDVISSSAVDLDASVTHSFDATALTAAADKEEIAVGDSLTDDGFFKVAGEAAITKRISSNTGLVTSIEVPKFLTGAIEFTVDSTSDVSFVVSSTGSTNTSAYCLMDTATKDCYAYSTVTGSSSGKTTVSATVPAGTYWIASPEVIDPDSSDPDMPYYNRGIRIYSTSVITESTNAISEIVENIGGSTETTTEETTTEVTTETQDNEFAVPEAGKAYSVDFATLNNDGYVINDKLNGKFFAGNTVKIVSEKDTAYYHDGSHGLAIADGDQIQVAVAGDATITLTLCQYGNGVEYVVTDADGNAVKTVAAKGTTDGEQVAIDYTGVATTLNITLTAAGEAYLHAISVSNAAEPIGEAENFELWLDDIATDVAGADGTVTKTVEPGEYPYKDSTLTLIGSGDTKFTPELEAGKNIIRDGKTVNAYKAGPRNANANDIQTIPAAGDGSAIIFKPAATGTFVTYFYSSSFLRVWDFSNDGTRNGYVDSDVAPDSYAFKAEAGHTYVLSTTGKTNNMAYAGFKYIIDEPVTVSVSLNPRGTGDYSKTEIYLTDVDLGTVEATVTQGKTAVELAMGHSYKLSTNDGGVRATVAESDTFVAGNEPIVIDLDDINDETLTGTITGTPAGTVTGITFTNMINGNTYEAAIDGETYSVVLKPGEYNTSVVTTNGGVTYDRVSVVEGGTAAGTNVNEVYVEVPVDDGSKDYDLPTEVANVATDLVLNGITPNNSTSVKGVAGSTIVVPVNGVQKVTVAGWYAGTWDINGQNSVTADSSSNASSPVTTSYITDGSETSVTVNVTGDGANYLYWIKVENMVAFTPEISVPGDYDTLTDAVTAIRTMVDRPDGEAGRVTINLTADIQEQVVIDTPYVAINGNGHTISWYYGVGTFYYSVDGNGLYNERLFRDKYSSNEASGSLWGGTVIVRGDYFRAENTTFKNTYNYEVTDKEILDFAKTATSAFPQRTSKDVDVQTYAAKERSNALYVDANFLECYNCNILASQDTLGANKATDDFAYFKDCVIGGNTDFICGAGNMVFDNCELQWKSVTKDESGNNLKLIGPTPRDGQYVFRNCDWTVDTTSNGPVSGKFGRTWQENSKSAFINTETNGLISADGWGEMSAGQLLTAQFIEYNNYAKGIPMDVSSMGNMDYTTNTKLSDEDVKAIVDNFLNDDYTINTVLGGWSPVHYGQTENEFTTEPDTETTTFLPIIDNGWEYSADNEDDDIVYVDGTIYEDNRVQILAAQNLNNGTETVPVTIEDRTYAKNLTSTGTNTVINVDNTVAKTYRIHNKITAKEDIKLMIDNKVGGGKLNAVIKNIVDTGEVNSNGDKVYTAETVTNYDNTAGGDSVFTTFVIELKAGDVVYFAGQGTNPSVYGFNVEGGTTFVDNGWDYDANNETVDNIIYAGDTVYEDFRGKITAYQNLGVKAETVPVTIEDRTYDKNLTSSGANTIINVDGTGAKTYRIHHEITAKQDMTIKIDNKVGGGKLNTVIKNLVDTGEVNDSGAKVYTAETVTNYDNTAGGESVFTTFVVELKAGETVYFAGQGTNPAVYGFDIVGENSNPDVTDIWGDVDGNGEVNITDVSLTLEYTLRPDKVSGFNADLADVSGNKEINSEDVALILQKVLDSTFKFPVENNEPTPDETTEVTTETATEATTSEATETTTSTEPVAKATVYVVGDSTACDYVNTDNNYYYKRVGYGTVLSDYLTADATVVNLALSGRSSKSFTSEANYQTLLSGLKEGDYLLIGFGHNDEKAEDAARYTAPGGTKEDAGTFKNSLYENYIKPALAAKATPILVTPIVRRTATGTWSDAQLHKANGGDYSQDMRDLGAELGITVVDATSLTKDLYDKLTPANTIKLHAWTNSKDTSVDNTHLNNYGAKYVSYMIAESLKASTSTLAAYVKNGNVAPTEADINLNPDYVEPSTGDPTDLTSLLWSTTSPYYASVFGDIGGTGKLQAVDENNVAIPDKLAVNPSTGNTYFNIAENSDGSVNIRAGELKEDNITAAASVGKISSTTDGMAMYYLPVDASTNFEISGTITVNGANKNNQVAFGAIVTDMLRVDEYNAESYTYVAASPLRLARVGTTDATTGAAYYANGTYARIDGKLVYGPEAIKQDITPGTKVNVSIKKVGNQFTATYGDITETYTVDMTGTVYAGFFAARCADITVSNIKYNNEVVE